MKFNRVIDLTLTIEHGTRGYEVNPICFFNQYQTIRDDGYNLMQVILNSHVATHIDAPYHFLEDGLKLDEIPLERLMGEAVVVDCSYKQAKELITMDDLMESKDQVKENDVVLIRTDWDRYYPGRVFDYDMPNVSLECIDFFIEKKIKILGLQTPSLNWVEDNPGAHRMLLGAGVLLVEGLANLGQIRKKRCFFMALPLKLKGLDGFPVRALAFEE